MGKTLEGESPLLKEGALSLQTSLSHRELSHRTPLLQERKFVSLFVTAGFCGKVFLSDWEVRARNLGDEILGLVAFVSEKQEKCY